MINLLTPEDKRANLKEYHLRFLTSAVLLLNIFIVVALVPLLTANIVIAGKIKNERDVLVSEPTSRLAREQLETISDLNKKIDILRASSANTEYKYPLSLLFKKIEDKILEISPAEDPVISLKSLSYGVSEIKKRTSRSSDESKVTVEHRLVVSGVAQTRQDFLSFIDILGKEPLFLSATSPITGLVVDRDINFSVNILLDNK